MKTEQKNKNLQVPEGPVDVVLDTDTFNEIDDQFAISYLFRCPEKLRVQALYAAPFHNKKSSGPEDGMEKSYCEILKILSLLGETTEVFKGSRRFMEHDADIVDSPAARDLVKRAASYSPEKPLYLVAIGAITNIASALLQDPSIAEKIVIVWLGGHARHYAHTKEFNMCQDYSAARVIMRCGAPFVQLPCAGVVSEFTISGPELEFWLIGKNPLCDYLAKNTIAEASPPGSAPRPWTRVIWDVTAVAWLMNDGGRFMESKITETYFPEGNSGQYAPAPCREPMQYVFRIHRDALMQDLIERISK